jgi:uncharacterized protein YcgI (DUF1989 family)
MSGRRDIRLTLHLNDQQLEILERALPAAGVDTVAELVPIALAHDARRPVDERRRVPRPPAAHRPSPPDPSASVDELVAAGTGLGVALAEGDRLRVEQVVDGQGADLNAFALRPPRQRFDAARTRATHGARVSTGATLWSSPPEIPLLAIEADSAGPHDLTFPACSAFEFEQLTGIPGHSNCVDIQREVQRHWGIDERDQHDPLNLWLPTGVEPDGTLCWWPVGCRRGDHVELRALTDVLVVVNPCASDLFGASPYELEPVRVIVRPGDPGRPAPAVPTGPPPVFAWRDLPLRAVEVTVPAEHADHVARVRAGGWFGDDGARVVRALLLRWWEDVVAQLGGASR